ncbi:MAG: carboxypeptidase regulatory-like domain-containing protein [Paludibacteraceae bacterium]|nr:carboxypeptidase regulatory-like domain-containing protein [Paludibacteraceae bacterium]
MADNLDKETRYYVRAFVKNEVEILYGEQIEFSTGTNSLQISLIYATATASTIAGIRFSVESNGGNPVEETGICWNTEPLPTKDKNYIKAAINSSTTITGLTPNTTYYLRAYAKNSEGEVYSNQYTRKTLDGTPTVTTASYPASTGIDYLTISGTSSSPDNIPIIRQGICYSSSSSVPTINDLVVIASDLSSPFSCQISGLKSGTKYYCRAFAENEYSVGYGKVISASTESKMTTLTGYIYDQDNMPINGAQIQCGSYQAVSNNKGYYELSFYTTKNTNTFSVSAGGYETLQKTISITPQQSNQHDFYLTLSAKFDVDLGTGYWADGASYMLFECKQPSLAGRTTSKNMRIKNYRSIPVPWSITNVPSDGIIFSQTNGTIPPNSEISVNVTFTYPATNNSQLMQLSDCVYGSKAYVWNWEYLATGAYVYEVGITSSGGAKVGVTWKIGYDNCVAVCQQNIFLNIGGEACGFTLHFNQFVTY